MSDLWIDIDLDAIVSNYQEVIKHLKPASRCMAVVKANAYGMGAVTIAQALEQAGCQAFAVTKVDEGLSLRRSGVSGLILVLGPSSPSDWAEAVAADLHLTIADISGVEGLEEIARQQGRQVNIHLKIETGMGRTGIVPAELADLAVALQRSPHVRVVGVYTHFARAAQRDRTYMDIQYQLFQTAVRRLQELQIDGFWQHVCNSAAFLDYPEWQHDFVRVGTLLIGHFPAPAFAGRLSLRDPWSAKGRIVYMHKVSKGTFVGYQSIYRTKRNTRLVLIAAGYADGFGLEPHLTPQGWWDLGKIVVKNLAALFGIFLGQEKITINGQVVRVAGKIGMQLTVLDVGDLECLVGDEVTIPIRRTLANPYIERRYWQNGKILAKTILKEGVSTLNKECSH